MVGNLISDFVKGKSQYDYPESIQQGIKLHRLIDNFTDNHQAVARAKTVFRSAYRLYSGAFVDVSFDYFVANDSFLFATDNDLQMFANKTYSALRENQQYLPPLSAPYFKRMQEQNWLYNYRFVWGIQKSFGGIVYRSKYLTDSHTAGLLFEENFFELKTCYEWFIPDLLGMVKEWGIALQITH